MPDSAFPSAVFLPDLSLGRFPPNTRMTTVNFSLPFGPFPSYGLYAWDFLDVNRVAPSTLPQVPPFPWDSIPNSNKCGEPELVSVFEDWDSSPSSIVMGEDDIQNLVISAKSLDHTPLSTSSETNDNGPPSGSENDVQEEPSPQTPSSMMDGVAQTERSCKSTPQLSIDTTFKSLSFLESPLLIYK